MADETKYRAAHQEAFTACDGLEALLRTEVRRVSGHSNATSADKIVSGLFVRAINIWCAAIELVSDGYGLAAGMLNRPLFEALADIAWTSTHQGEAETLFAEHDEFSRMYVAEKLRDRDYEPLLPINDERLAELKRRDKFGAHGQHHWSTRNVNDRLNESHSAFTREGEWEDVREAHDLGYFWSNQLLHGASLGLGHAVESATAAQLTLRAGPCDKDLVKAMHTCSWTIVEIAAVALRHFDYAAETEAFWQIADLCLTSIASHIEGPQYLHKR